MTPTPHPDHSLTLVQARRISYTVKLLTGLATGLTIMTYLLLIGWKVVDVLPTEWGLEVTPGQVGLLALALTFAVEWFLEVPAGAAADVRGKRATFMWSFALRGAFPLALIASFTLLPETAWWISAGVSVAMLVFAVAFTLFSGNFEQYLAAVSENPAQCRSAFGLAKAIFYLGILAGAAVAMMFVGESSGQALLDASLVPYLLSSAMCFAAMLISWRLPEAEREREADLQASMREARAALRSDPVLNKTFWSFALVYGLTQAIEATVALFLLTSVEDITQAERFWLLTACLWAPPMLGAASLIPRSPGARSHHDLLRPTLLFCGAVALMPVCRLADGSFAVLLGGTVIIARILYGRLETALFEFNSQRANRACKSAPTALLSIGERRKKIGAILCLGIVAIGPAIKVVLLWSMGAAALAVATHSFITLGTKAKRSTQS